MNVPKIIIVASHVPILLTVAYAAVSYKALGKELRVFCWFVFLSGAIQFSSLLLWFLKRNNLPLLHLYVAAGFMCLAWFYKTLLGDFINAKLIWGIAALFLAFTLINSLFIQSIFTFDSKGLAVESVLIVILALFTFIFLLNDIVKATSGHDIKSLTWINSGLFIFYSSGLLIFYFGDIITHTFPESLNHATWVLHSFFSVVMYICFFAGLWKRSRA